MDQQLPSHDYQYVLASFWNARTLELDSHTNKRLAQVYPDLNVFHWMSNLDSYNHDFTFVVVNQPASGPADINGTSVIEVAGTPNKVSNCQNFQLYVYEPGSEGHTKLNDFIKSNLQKLKN